MKCNLEQSGLVYSSSSSSLAHIFHTYMHRHTHSCWDNSDLLTFLFYSSLTPKEMMWKPEILYNTFQGKRTVINSNFSCCHCWEKARKYLINTSAVLPSSLTSLWANGFTIIIIPWMSFQSLVYRSNDLGLKYPIFLKVSRVVDLRKDNLYSPYSSQYSTIPL